MRTAPLGCFLVLGCAGAGITPVARLPVVAIDEAHHNVHTADGTYRPLVDVLRASGFTVVQHTESFRRISLDSYDVLVISNARGAGADAPLEERGRPAFLQAEIEALAAWTSEGGSLLLVLDHYPIPAASADLLSWLAVDATNGITEDPRLFDDNVGAIVFDQKSGAVGDHPITCGAGSEQRIERVATFGGTSLGNTTKASPLLMFSGAAVDQLRPSPEARPAAGRNQAIAMRVGRGQAVILGEAAALRIFDAPSTQNEQFAINVVAWLAGRLHEDNALGCRGSDGG